MTDYCFEESKQLGQMAGVWNFFENFDPISHQCLVNKRKTIFFQKSSPGSLDNTFFTRNLDYRF